MSPTHLPIKLRFAPHVFIIIICTFLGGPMGAQITRSPITLVESFDRVQHGIGLYTPDIDASNEQFVVAANGNGLLWSHGADWEVIPLPNRTQVRSVASTCSGAFCGGQGFVGHYTPAQNGHGGYWEDFTDSISNVTSDFTDVWRLYSHFDDSTEWAILTTSQFAGVLQRNGRFQQLISGNIRNAFPWDDGMGVQTDGEVWQINRKGKIIHRMPFDLDIRIEAVVQTVAGNWAFLSHQKGVFTSIHDHWVLLQTPLSQFLRDSRTNCILPSEGGWFIGTSESGIVFTSDLDSFELVANESTGLVRNTVLHMDDDSKGNIWVALEGGIDLLRNAWPQRIPKGTAVLQEPGFGSLHLASGEHYWGTSQGLHFQKNPDAPLIKVDGIDGQVWFVDEVEQDIWVGHLNGAGIIRNGQYVSIIKGTGVWGIWRAPDSDHWYAGTYLGLIQLQPVSMRSRPSFQAYTEWLVIGRMSGFNESSRFLVFEDFETLWVSHPYKGAFRMKLNHADRTIHSIKAYREAEGFPAPLDINICQIDDQIYFATTKGFYEWDPVTDRMYGVSDELGQWCQQDFHYQRIYKSPDGSLWFFQNQIIGRISPLDDDVFAPLHLTIAPMQETAPMNPFESIEFLPDGMACVPTENGFVYLDPDRMIDVETATQVTVMEAQHINHPSGSQLLTIESIALPAGSHALQFRLAGLNSIWTGVQQYQWRIPNISDSWSLPQLSPRVTLSGLVAGTHNIEFRAFIADGLTGKTTTVPVFIAPYWYDRNSIRLVILLLAIGMAYIYMRWKQGKLQTEHDLQSQLESTKREQSELKYTASLLETEERLAEEKLHRQALELDVRNKELASATMHLVQKSRLIHTLENGLKGLRENIPPDTQESINGLLRIIKEGGRLDDAWAQFTEQFDQVHVAFHKRLHTQYSDLTKNDIKLCTYLRMNLSSKEIASLMFVSVRAVEVSRSRLRKRLGLEKGANLLQFIQSL